MSWILILVVSAFWVWIRPKVRPKDAVEVWICLILDIITLIPALVVKLLKKALF